MVQNHKQAHGPPDTQKFKYREDQARKNTVYKKIRICTSKLGPSHEYSDFTQQCTSFIKNQKSLEG